MIHVFAIATFMEMYRTTGCPARYLPDSTDVMQKAVRKYRGGLRHYYRNNRNAARCYGHFGMRWIAAKRPTTPEHAETWLTPQLCYFHHPFVVFVTDCGVILRPTQLRG